MKNYLRPDFIIGGAPRSGTTFLCHALDKHPDIYIAKPYVPEPKVFIGPDRSRDEYIAHYHSLFSTAPEEKFLGEKTTLYFESEDAHLKIHDLVPEAKMIFMIREPVARAYSNYLWSTKNGLENLSFEQAIKIGNKRPSPLPPEKSYARPFDYLERGDYVKFSRRYIDLFGQKNVGFFLYEHLLSDPNQLLSDIQSFIGVKPMPIEQLYSGIVNSASEVGPAINPEFERQLKKKMAANVREFADLAGLDVSVWGYDL